MKTSLILTLAATLGLASAAQAALLLQENFEGLNTDPTDNQNNLGGQNGWTADSGVTVVAGGLSYNSGAITIAGGANRVESNMLSTGLAPLATKSFASQSSEVWFSFTMVVDSSTNNSRYWFWVSNNTDLNTGLTASVSDNNTSNKNFFSEIRVGSTPVSTVAGGAVEDQIYFFVARLSKDGSATNTDAYDRMELWVNPNSTSLSGAFIANAPAGAGVIDGISHFGLTALSTAADLQWDNLRIGTTQADVLDVYAIPEPSSFAALAGLGALGLVGLRRRSRR